MLKKSLLILLTAGLVSIAGSYLVAQDNSAPSQQVPPSQGEREGHHGPPDPARRTERLTRELKLSPDQQAKVRAALESERSQMEGVHQNTTLSQADRHTKMMAIHQNSDGQIRSLLDSTQQAKWDQMQAKREQWMQNRRQGPPNGTAGQQPPPDAGSEQGPPPQQ